MKIGRFFWGTFFVVVGLLLLLYNLDYLHFDWSYSWRLWPLLLIFWGLSKFTENRPVRIGLAMCNGIVLACMFFGFFSFQWFDGIDDDSEPARYSQQLSEPYNNTIQRAVFNLSGGAGKFVMTSTTDNLIDAETESGLGRYELDKYEEKGSTEISLRMEDHRSFRFFHRLRNRADIRLNPNPEWQMHFSAGASTLDLDLTPYKTTTVTLDAGVTTVRVKLGDRSKETTVNVKTGVSSVRIEIPATSGCEIADNAHIGSSSFEDFHKSDSQTWQTDGFDSATNKIFIDIDSGVSSVRVTRY
ncbi:MAG TPA: DUF5668 domain-containing protein [Bacteroidota bacterium]